MRVRRTFLLCAIGVLLLLASAGPALAVAPEITVTSPADGSPVQGPFTLRFSAYDADKIVGGSARVTVGGTTLTPSFAYGGHWEGDGCDSWWVEDRTSANFTCSIPDLPGGESTITMQVTDTAGETATATTTVVRVANVAWSGFMPSPGLRYTSIDELVIFGACATPDTASASLAVDGVPVPFSVALVSSDKARITATTSLGSGTHTITAGLGDGTPGMPPSTKSWTFQIDPAATPPSVGAVTPADGSTVQGPFTLAYDVSDPQKIDGTKARVLVDGVEYAATVSYGGHWEDDGCSSWWVEDRTAARITASIPDLAPGPHAVRLVVADVLGSAAVKKTVVHRSATIVASGHTPAADSRNGSVDLVSVTLSGATIDPATVLITIDGAPVPHTFLPTADGGVVRYDGSIASGGHEVMVSASDIFGSPAWSTRWSFTVDAAPPEIVSLTPDAGATLTLADAGVTVRLRDADAVVSGSVVLRLDGSVVPVTVTNEAADTVVKWQGVLAEGSHNATITASDVAGNVVTRPWSFTVADPPRFGEPQPSAPVSSAFEISVPVQDVNCPLSSDVGLTVDGVPVPATLSLSDARSGTVRASVSGLADGAHEAVVTVSDTAGNTATRTWSITVDAKGPVLTSRKPAPGTTLANSTVVLEARFDDEDNVDLASAAMWIDGAAVNAGAEYDGHWDGDGCDSWWVPEPDKAVVSLQTKLKDGPHTAKVRIRDVFGNESTTEWSFTVSEKPSIKSLLPAPNTRTTANSVGVSATITDFDGIAETAVSYRRANHGQAAGEWVPLASHVDASGKLTATLVPPTNETRYELLLRVEDTGGLVTTATTDVFFASSAAQMSAGTDCVSCHPTIMSTHRMTDCAACHFGDSGGPCAGSYCHGSSPHPASWMTGRQFEDHGGPYTGRTCTSCHSHSLDNESQRHSSNTPDCAPCHAQALTTEHTGKTTSTGESIGCPTCHASSDTTVTAAVAAGNLRCEACHGDTSGHGVVHERDALDVECGRCHQANLLSEHRNTVTQETPLHCRACHENTTEAVTGALARDSKDCFACHSRAHGSGFAESVPADIPLYPGYEWTAPQDAALWKGLEWMPDELASGGRIVISSRRNDVDGDAVAAFYRDEMSSAGWTMISPEPAPGNDFFALSFAKGTRRALVWFYGGPSHDAEPRQPAGHRLEVIYR